MKIIEQMALKFSADCPDEFRVGRPFYLGREAQAALISGAHAGFLAGAKAVIEMMRSTEAWRYYKDDTTTGLNPIQWADWLERDAE